MGKVNKNKGGFGPKGIPWFRMPSEITLSNELTPYHYRMLAVLLERDDLFQSTKGIDKFWCSKDWLVSHSGMKRTKAGQILDELEEKGFITQTKNGAKHRENTFHINWDFINSYRRPRTQKELEEKEDTTIVEEPTNPERSSYVATSTQTSQKDELRPQWERYRKGPLDWMYTPYNIRHATPEQRAAMGMPIPMPEHPLPAEEWYSTTGRQFIRDTYFPELLSMEQSGKDNCALAEFVYSKMLLWVMPCVIQEDDMYVWKQVIKPDYEEYKREQTSNGNA